MYPNLYMEIAQKRIPIGVLAEKLNCSVITVALMLVGEVEITFNEAKQFKDAINTETSLEELFEEVG